MITADTKDLIQVLYKQGKSIQEISSTTGVSRQTIYRYVKIPQKTSSSTSKSFIPKKLLPYERTISTLMRKGILNGKKIHQTILQDGYQGSYSTLHRFLITTREEKFIKKYKTSNRYDTALGEEAQVDWGSFGKITVNGNKTRLYCFVYVLGWSRMMYIEFTVKQNLQTLQECHIHAFKELGIPQTILYDNMKTVVINREKTSTGGIKINYNKGFSDFAQYYGFNIKLSHPYWPRSKGKVEAGVKYVRNNFIHGLKHKKKLLSLNEINKQAKVWIANVVNVREHKGIQDRRPLDLWKKEKNYLHFPEIPPYKTAPFVVRNSTKDQLIHYKRNFYSVPKEYSRRKLYVREINTNGIIHLEIYYKDTLIATHYLAIGRGNLIFDDKHHVNKSEKSRLQVSKKDMKNRQKKIRSMPKIMIRPLSYYNQIIPKL